MRSSQQQPDAGCVTNRGALGEICWSTEATLHWEAIVNGVLEQRRAVGLRSRLPMGIPSKTSQPRRRHHWLGLPEGSSHAAVMKVCLRRQADLWLTELEIGSYQEEGNGQEWEQSCGAAREARCTTPVTTNVGCCLFNVALVHHVAPALSVQRPAAEVENNTQAGRDSYPFKVCIGHRS